MLLRIPHICLFARTLSAILEKRAIAETVQGDWIAPAAPDNNTVIQVGDEYTLQWTYSLWEWFSLYAPSADVSNVDLWITGYYQHQFAHLIAERVKVNESAESIWRVQVPEDELEATQYWVFRFLPSATVFSETADSISSPGFRIINSTEPETTTSTSSLATSSTSASTSASPKLTATTTPKPIKSTPDTLSAGAKAGIAIAAAFIAIILIASGWFLARRRKSPQHAPNRPSDAHDPSPYSRSELGSDTKNIYNPQFISKNNAVVQPSELGLGHERPRAELG